MERFDAFGIGLAVRDVSVLLDRFPRPDEKLTARALVEEGGGPVPTALVTLARLGRRTGFGGLLGDDAVGRLLRDGLAREGVDVSGLVLAADVRSPTSVILVENGRRTIFECYQSELARAPELVDPAALPLERTRSLLVDARLPAVQIEAARRARAAGALVVLDCGHPRAGVDELLALTDVAILSHTYPAALYGEGYDLDAFLAELVRRLPEDGPRIAGVTLGAEGCALYLDGRTVRIAGYPVPDVVDTTGAGDVFHAALLHRLLAGDEPVRAARFANVAAALKCRGPTGRFPLPPEEEILRRAEEVPSAGSDGGEGLG